MRMSRATCRAASKMDCRRERRSSACACLSCRRMRWSTLEHTLHGEGRGRNTSSCPHSNRCRNKPRVRLGGRQGGSPCKRPCMIWPHIRRGCRGSGSCYWSSVRWVLYPPLLKMSAITTLLLRSYDRKEYRHRRRLAMRSLLPPPIAKCNLLT